jgi:hypothetical protein
MGIPVTYLRALVSQCEALRTDAQPKAFTEYELLNVRQNIRKDTWHWELNSGLCTG